MRNPTLLGVLTLAFLSVLACSVSSMTQTQVPQSYTIGDTVANDKWNVKVVSVSREETLSDWRGSYPAIAGHTWLLVEIQLFQVPPQKSMTFGSGSFVVVDRQGNRFSPVGANTSNGWLIIPVWAGDVPFQAYNFSECGDGCQETYNYVFTEKDLWQVSATGERWQQTYLYNIPMDALGLSFVFDDMPQIDLGH